jgi:hypothetical protein
MQEGIQTIVGGGGDAQERVEVRPVADVAARPQQQQREQPEDEKESQESEEG